MIKLDDRDIKILSILQREGRIAKTALAERVNLSPTPCWERLKRLEKAGIIEGYGAKVSWSMLGAQTIVFMEAEIASHQANDFQRFEQAMQEYDEILECWAVGGGLDYLLKIAVKTVDEYQRLVDRLLNAQIGLKKYFTYIVTKRVKSSRSIPDNLLKTISPSE
jgi:Lrp/AsnC family transcriptional regulator of ectoine degradation